MAVITKQNQQHRLCTVGLGQALIKLLTCFGIVVVVYQVLNAPTSTSSTIESVVVVNTAETGASSNDGNNSNNNTLIVTSNPQSSDVSQRKQQRQRQQHQIPQTLLKNCSVSWEQASPFSKSQRKQDLHLISTYFPNACDGTYLEMGALNGKSLSNTYILKKSELNWTGVLVEGNPYIWDHLRKYRPDEIAIVPSAICREITTVHYLGGIRRQSNFAGIWEFMAEEEKQKFWKGYTINDTIAVSCKPLSSVLEQTVGDHFHFDFYSLDVEGAELQVLESVDFTKVSFGVLNIEAQAENEAKNKRIIQLLEKEGYRQHVLSSFEMWYIHPQFDDIYAHLGKKRLFDNT